jgi:hypothetical protein
MSSSYDASSSLRDARALYFERNGLPPDGGASRRWIKVTSGRLPLYLLNTAPRRRAVPYHDLHHVLTGYETTNVGEAEISAWELAAGTWPHWIALFLDLAGTGVGILIAPRRSLRAFVRGRHCRSLYREPFGDALLSRSVAETRTSLGLDAATAPVRARDVAAFALTAAAGALVLVSLVVFAPIFVLLGLVLR